MNNPIRFLDPNGMYSTEEWKRDNRISDDDLLTVYEADDCPTCPGGDNIYAQGAVVDQGVYGKWEYEGEGNWKDINTGKITNYDDYTRPKDPGKITEFKPNFFGRVYEELDNSETHIEFTGKFIYSILDDAYVSFAQTGPYRRRLDESGVWPNKIADAGVNTLVTANPWTSLSLGIPSKTLNAGQFNRFYAGTGLNSGKKGIVKSFNNIVKNYHSLQKDLVPFLNWKGIFDTTQNSISE